MKVRNPTGRLEWLAATLVERTVAQKNHPVLTALYAELKAPLENVLRAHLGPRNRKLRDVRKYIDQGNRMLAASRERVA